MCDGKIRGKKTCFDAGIIGFCHCASVLQAQVQNLYVDLGLSLLCNLVLGTYSKFARKIKFLALGVYCPAGHLNKETTTTGCLSRKSLPKGCLQNIRIELPMYVSFIGLRLTKTSLTLINRTRLRTKGQSAGYPQAQIGITSNSFQRRAP